MSPLGQKSGYLVRHIFLPDFSLEVGKLSQKSIPCGGGESRAVFALCPAQTKNAREKTDSLANFLNFNNTPGSLKSAKKRPKQTNFETQNIDLHK